MYHQQFSDTVQIKRFVNSKFVANLLNIAVEVSYHSHCCRSIR